MANETTRIKYFIYFIYLKFRGKSGKLILEVVLEVELKADKYTFKHSLKSNSDKTITFE
jgi:hypothetical protein